MKQEAGRSFTIVFAIWPGMTHLDFTGPHQVLSRLPNATVIVASPAGGNVDADGLTFGNTVRIADVRSCDLICVPGGIGAAKMAQDVGFVGAIRRLALGAQYVTSVCTGSLILGAAGLLKDRRAACHWAWAHQLELFGAVHDPARVVRDIAGDWEIITGGGVTAGIDFAFTVLAEVAGADFAQTVQLGLEYAPAPPFDSGRPETAPTHVLERFQGVRRKMMETRDDEARVAAGMMAARGHGDAALDARAR